MTTAQIEEVHTLMLKQHRKWVEDLCQSYHMSGSANNLDDLLNTAAVLTLAEVIGVLCNELSIGETYEQT